MSGPRTPDSKRSRTVRRILRLTLRLSTTDECPPLPTLAGEFRVCTRTVRRDLYALQDAGWPVPEQSPRAYAATSPAVSGLLAAQRRAATKILRSLGR